MTSGVPVAEVTVEAPMKGCGGRCNTTSVMVTVTSVEVHTSGINNMTGMWSFVCTNQMPMTLNLTQLSSVTKLLCGAPFQPDTITNVRLYVSSANATIPGTGVTRLNVPSGKLEIPISPLAQIEAGKTTSITVEFEPHIVCPGNGGDCKLTPVLHAISQGPS